MFMRNPKTKSSYFSLIGSKKNYTNDDLKTSKFNPNTVVVFKKKVSSSRNSIINIAPNFLKYVRLKKLFLRLKTTNKNLSFNKKVIVQKIIEGNSKYGKKKRKYFKKRKRYLSYKQRRIREQIREQKRRKKINTPPPSAERKMMLRKKKFFAIKTLFKNRWNTSRLNLTKKGIRIQSNPIVAPYRVCIRTAPNNMFITFTTSLYGKTVSWSNTGTGGFSGPRRSSIPAIKSAAQDCISNLKKRFNRSNKFSYYRFLENNELKIARFKSGIPYYDVFICSKVNARVRAASNEFIRKFAFTKLFTFNSLILRPKIAHNGLRPKAKRRV